MSDTITLVKEEYFHLQNTVEDFDQRALTIKAWSVTASMVVVGTSISQHASSLALLAAAASFSFWVTEALWKVFQRAYYRRIEAIEAAFRSNDASYGSPLQIYAEWERGYNELGIAGLLETMFYLNVMLPHVFIVIGGTFFWYYSKK